MWAKVIEGKLGEVGKLLVRFDPHASEMTFLHSHETSARVVRVLEGGGVFVAKRNGTLGAISISKGHVVLMPPSIEHTFVAAESGMSLHSIHAPYQGLTGLAVIKESAERLDVGQIASGEITLPGIVGLRYWQLEQAVPDRLGMAEPQTH